MKTYSERVVEAALAIPEGRVTTYGRLSAACGGGSMSSQSITGILSKAAKEKGVKIPFHRIVYADGSIWIDESHRKDRLALYKKEGIEITENDKVKSFQEILFDFK